MSWLLLVNLVFVNLVTAASDDHVVSIAFLADRYGEVAPCHCDSQPLGGVDRQAGAIREWRKNDPDLVVIDGGDNFYAKPDTPAPADSSARAELIADALADMRVSVAVPGELDFAAGAADVRNLGARGHLIWVLSNVAPPASRPPMFLPYRAVTAHGQKILVLAVWSSETLPTAIKNEGYKLEDPVAALKSWVTMYRNSVDMIVVVAHTTGQVEEKIADEVPEISLILSSHEGRLQFGARATKDTQIVSVGNHGKYLMRVDLHYRHKLPHLIAGPEVQKYFRTPEKDREMSPIASADCLFFQLLPLAADVASEPGLKTRAQAIDGVGYEVH